jgi:hypothetical protein
MNDLEKLLWHHNPNGAAHHYVLTHMELDEIIKAAKELGAVCSGCLQVEDSYCRDCI